MLTDLRQTGESSCIASCIERTGFTTFIRVGTDLTDTITLRIFLDHRTARNGRETRLVYNDSPALLLFFTRPLHRPPSADFVNSEIKPTSPAFVLVNVLIRSS